MEFTQTGIYAATGFIVVFIVLIFLVFVFWLLGRACGGAFKREKTPAKEVVEPAVLQRAPAVSSGISGEIVAAIAAAVYTVMGENVTIKSVKRSIAPRAGTSEWKNAGLAELTRPF